MMTERLSLRNWPMPARLVLGVFLIAVAIGYLVALANLHLEHAGPREWFPGPAVLAKVYAVPAEKPVSHIERLLVSTTGELNGMGSMRPAFFEKSRRWEALTKDRTPQEYQRLIDEREGECLALLSWVRGGANREAYEKDDYPLNAEIASRPITEEFLIPDAHEKKPAEPRRLRIRTLLERRCVDCHSEDGRHSLARGFPLESYDRLLPYCQAPKSHTIPADKLADATRMHLLAVALVYGATGLAFWLTNYSRPVRVFLGFGPMAAQLATIACWWLARLHPVFAYAVFYTGAAAAIGLAVQVGGCLWELRSEAEPR